MSEKKYTLTLSEKQLQVLSLATEVYSRLAGGQLEEAAREHMTAPGYRELYDALYNLRPLAVGSNAAHKALQEVSERGRMAWDIHAVVRHALAWEKHPQGGVTVDFDSPALLPACPEQELAEIQVITLDTSHFQESKTPKSTLALR